jgi:hypothetical protein
VLVLGGVLALPLRHALMARSSSGRPGEAEVLQQQQQQQDGLVWVLKHTRHTALRAALRAAGNIGGNSKALYLFASGQADLRHCCVC